jgi:hypothetical protein
VLKDIRKNIFDAFESTLRLQIRVSRYLRLPFDTIPEESTYVYRFLADDFLDLVKKQIPMKARKEILKASLQGLVDLHSCDVVHLGK